MAVRGIRGATTVEKNDSTLIIDETKVLLNEILKANDLLQEDIASIIFTATNDIDASFPAVAARQIGISDVALMCMKEIDVPGSLQKCVRILMHVNTEKENSQLNHIYLKGATILRPDIANSKKKSNNLVIALDGPAGAGKSTVAKAIAKKMDILYLDTGAMYRAAALMAVKQGLTVKDAEKVKKFAENLDMSVKYENGTQQIYVDGENVTGKIRTPEISKAASDFSAVPEIRLKLVEIQRNVAKNISVIMDGRDIGTYVFPNADVKIFLTACPEVRAFRRYMEEKEKGNVDISYDDILRDINLRDKNDSTRCFAPLAKAEDAVMVDTTNMDEAKVINKISTLILNK